MTDSLHVYRTQARSLPDKEQYPNHESISALWNRKWRVPCSMGVYPFMDGNLEDFDPVFKELIEVSLDNINYINDPDSYATPFVPVGKSLAAKAKEYEQIGDNAKALEYYLRAGAVFRISRFPIVRTSLGKEIWEMNKEVYLKAGAFLSPPIQAIDIPFKHANTLAGDEDRPINAYLRVPRSEKPRNGWPILLFICGLDAYKTDNTPRTQAHVDNGVATLSFEIPGTGDCPASNRDPHGTDRLMSSVIAWVESNAGEHGFDTSKILARGISTGGYNAMRVAHTHADHFLAVIAQGGGAHHMFDEKWIRDQNSMEYPWGLANALAFKFGYASLDEYATGSQKTFSLMQEPRLFDKNCKMLIINGMEDSIFPIEDSILVALKGSGKDLLCRGNLRHMGNPGGEEIITEWINKILAN